MKKSSASIAGTVVIVLLAVVVFLNRQWLRDMYVAKTTPLSSSSQTLASDIKLTDYATFIYKASQPAVDQSEQFNEACKNVQREQSIVLGCYNANRIYIYDVTDQRLNGVKQVTAAHELLHAIYQRMPSNEKKQVNSLLETAAASITDKRFMQTLAEYRKTEPDQIDNELHSIIGTEIANISPALERHYRKYFLDRRKIVSYSTQYEATFTALTDQINKYDTQLASLKQQKDKLDKALASQQTFIESESKRLNALKANGDIAAYNGAVPSYNAAVRTYNDEVVNLRQIITDYNSIVEKRNNLATTQNDLVHQLNSNYQPLQ